jgi:hypothetical protein
VCLSGRKKQQQERSPTGCVSQIHFDPPRDLPRLGFGFQVIKFENIRVLLK